MVCATRQEERTQQVAEETKGILVPGLATARKRAGLSQKELAARAGVTRQTISRIEQGGHAYYDTLDKLAKALRVSRKRLLEDVAPHQEHQKLLEEAP